jgi:ribose transport system permease protein
MPDLRELLRTRPFMFALLLAVALLVANIVAEPNFGKPGNWPEELATLAPFALVAMASTPSILSGGGGIDISVGPVAILSNVILVCWLLPHSATSSAWVGIPLVLLIGAAVGAVNGMLVALLRYQPVIATLCAFFVISGVVLKIAPNVKHPADGNWTVHLADKVGPIPGGLLLMAIPLAIWFALSRTAFHRNLYAVGGNDATAFSTGVKVATTRVLAYALGGMFAAVGGIALTALLQTSQTTGVTQYTLIALAAVALGGTSFAGGRGGLVASLLGAVCIYFLQTLLGSLHVSSTWLQVVYGGLLVVGVVVGARLTSLRPRAVAA